MPTKVITSNTDGTVVFTCPVDKIAKLVSIEVDNQSASDITITVEDNYIPFPTANNPNPTTKTTIRKVATVKSGDDILINFDDEVEILGECVIIGSVTTDDCKITVTWREE